MNGGQSRTFVLQAVAVTIAIGIVYFAFLRPSDPDDLAGIQAPDGDAPTFTAPGDKADGGKRARSKGRPEDADRPPTGQNLALVRTATRRGGPTVAPAADGPADDQYIATATALMERVRATAGEPPLRRR